MSNLDLWTCPNCGCNKYATEPPNDNINGDCARRVCLDCNTFWIWDAITNDYPGFEEGYDD